jgi:hypothetical protein
MRINSIAQYALMGALAVSLGCARNTEDMEDGTATGQTRTADTTTVPTRTDTAAVSDTAPQGAGVVGAHPDSADYTVSPMDSVRTGVVDVNRDSAAAGADTAGNDSLRIHRDSAHVDPGAGWPKDSSQGGWSTTPSDSL